MTQSSSPATPAARSAGANSPTEMLAHHPVVREGTKVPAACPKRATEGVGNLRLSHSLDTSIRPLSSLSREEVAELARNAADNFLPVREANGFEPGTWQHTEFIRAWAHRQRELVEDAA